MQLAFAGKKISKAIVTRHIEGGHYASPPPKTPLKTGSRPRRRRALSPEKLETCMMARVVANNLGCAKHRCGTPNRLTFWAGCSFRVCLHASHRSSGVMKNHSMIVPRFSARSIARVDASYPFSSS